LDLEGHGNYRCASINSVNRRKTPIRCAVSRTGTRPTGVWRAHTGVWLASGVGGGTIKFTGTQKRLASLDVMLGGPQSARKPREWREWSVVANFKRKV